MFDMKYEILHDFRTSTPFEEKFSDRFKDLHTLKDGLQTERLPHNS